MTERPMLFSSPMVAGLLAGAKTVTRRALRAQPPAGTTTAIRAADRSRWIFSGPDRELWPDPRGVACPYGVRGDRIWVKETFARADQVVYRADDTRRDVRWTPSLFMTRALSRITLEVVETYPERLSAITEQDAVLEGCGASADGGFTCQGSGAGSTARDAYLSLWDVINGAGAAAADPFVWVVRFNVVG